MANVHSAKLTLGLTASISDANATGFGTVAQSLRLPWADLTLADGNGSGKVNKVYAAKYTVADAAAVTLDLNSGLVDVLGNALVFGNVKLIAIQNLTTTAGRKLKWNVFVTNGWATHEVGTASIPLVEPAGLLLRLNPAGWAVNGTNKIVKLENASGGPIDFEVMIIGSAS